MTTQYPHNYRLAFNVGRPVGFSGKNSIAHISNGKNGFCWAVYEITHRYICSVTKRPCTRKAKVIVDIASQTSNPLDCQDGYWVRPELGSTWMKVVAGVA